MLSPNQIRDFISQSVDSLFETGLVAERMAVSRDTVLFGATSPLDSIAFVTLIADIEDRLNVATGKDICIVLTEIGDFNESSPALTIGGLEDYLHRVIAE